MIDTSKFKGHTPGPWIITHDKHEEGVDLRLTGRHPEPVMDFPYGEPEGPDLALIAAAPDLLVEVERLRELLLYYAPTEAWRHGIEVATSTEFYSSTEWDALQSALSEIREPEGDGDE